ncbi:MAG TPA: hypothetical protein VG406_11380 [Isosphaeraceae bacterium]|jgi:hypothetical protein|nr:hypothetical protein [Isosphaeraceae bacterium]
MAREKGAEAMATSERRIAANRENAKLAKGPKTPGGKANSRRNALKHGLTGKGVVLPADDEVELAARKARLVADLKPADDEELGLIDRMALAGHRMERAVRMETARRIQASGRALSSWAEDRRVAAEELALRLARRPSLVARQLRRTLQGCELLLDRWRGLLRTAEAGTAWDESGRSRALDLLGVPVDDREHHPRVHGKATAEDLAAIARAEIEHLEGRRDGYLEDEDESDRVLVETGLAFDDSPAGRRLWGYERANDRIFHRSLADLNRRRRARGADRPAARPRPSRPSPVASPYGVPSAPAPERVEVADGTPSVPAPKAAAATAPTIAMPTPAAPATSPPQSSGNRRQRRAREALARRRG